MEDIIKEYAKHPINWGVIESPTIAYTQNNVSCGEILSITMICSDTMIESIMFTGEGRMIMLASMSLLIERYEQSSIDTLMKVSPQEWKEVFTFPLSEKHLKSALLPLLALQNAFRKHTNTSLCTLEDYLETIH